MTTESVHFLRRTARRAERKLSKQYPLNRYRVVKVGRGPFRYRVERTQQVISRTW